MELFLLINIIALLVPVVVSLIRRSFHEINWMALILAIFTTGSFFVIRNIYLFNIGAKIYNPDHITGVLWFGIPMEDVLFFITVPYAFIFLYRWVSTYFNNLEIPKFTYFFSSFVTLLSGVLGVLYFGYIYTFLTLFVLALFNALVYYGFTPKWYSKFLIAFLFVLLPYVLIDGIITILAEDKILYHADDTVIGIYVFSIPVEDVFGFFLLFLMITSGYEYYQRKLFPKIVNTDPDNDPDKPSEKVGCSWKIKVQLSPTKMRPIK